MLDFDHAEIAFGQVVLEGNGEIVEKGENSGLAMAQATDQIRGGGAFRRATGRGQGRRVAADFAFGSVEQ